MTATPRTDPRVDPRYLWLVLPPVVAGLLVAAVFLVERVYPLGTPPAGTVAEAAARGDAARLMVLLMGGADPDRRSLVPAGNLSDDAFEIAPLDAAILGRQVEIMELLLRNGAHVQDRARSLCLAQAVAFDDAFPVLGAPDAKAADERLGPRDAARRCLGDAAVK